MELLANTLGTAIDAGAAIVLAGIGALIMERSGILNLGLEGFLALGAVAAVIAAAGTGSAGAGLAGAILAGAVVGLVFGILVAVFRANQVLCGLAAVLAGLGLANELGRTYAGRPLDAVFRRAEIAGLTDLPFVGRVLFGHDLLVFVTYLIIPAAVWLVLWRTRLGLSIRAIGDDPGAADSAGARVMAIRLGCCIVGGALAGAAGAALSLSFTPGWSQGVVAGRGWIALAVVIFASWRPFRLVFGAVLFGAMTSVAFIGQSQNWGLPAPILNMLPYVVTLALLAVSAIAAGPNARSARPAAIGEPYFREER